MRRRTTMPVIAPRLTKGQRRLLSIRIFVIVSVLGVVASTLYLYFRVSSYHGTRENFVWVTTAAEVELARYANAVLRIASTGGGSPAAIGDA